MMRILLVCGSGASSGFMAAAIRKAAKKNGLELSVSAKSDSELQDMADKTDIILIGPHLAYMEESIKSNPLFKDKKVAVIPQDIYGILDGERAIEFINKL